MGVSTRVREIIEGGCGLIVGLVTPEGRPFATRGAGLDLLEGDRQARLLLDTIDVAGLALPLDTDLDLAVAVTGADIRTLNSVQLKGRMVRVSTGTPADRVRADAYCEAFFEAVEASDGLPPSLMERWRPADVLAAVIDVHEVFDQTPGPGAGSLIGRIDR